MKGTIAGALTLGLMTQVLFISGLSPAYQRVIYGAVLVVALGIKASPRIASMRSAELMAIPRSAPRFRGIRQLRIDPVWITFVGPPATLGLQSGPRRGLSFARLQPLHAPRRVISRHRRRRADARRPDGRHRPLGRRGHHHGRRDRRSPHHADREPAGILLTLFIAALVGVSMASVL